MIKIELFQAASRAVCTEQRNLTVTSSSVRPVYGDPSP